MPQKKERVPFPPVSPSRVLCEGTRYILRQDHQFQCPECPLPSSPTLNSHFNLGMHGEVCPHQRLPASLANQLSGHRRPAPSPPPPHGPSPRQVRLAPSPTTRVLSEGSIPRPVRPRNLFNDFLATLPRPFQLPAAAGGSDPAPPAPSPPAQLPYSPSSPFSSSPSYSSLSLTTASINSSPNFVPSPPPRTPSPDVMLELYSHTRHPLDLRIHLTILPSWGVKGKKEYKGECVVCYGEDEHLQVQCKNCHTMKV